MITSFIMRLLGGETGMESDDWQDHTGWVLDIRPAGATGGSSWSLRIDFRDGTREAYHGLPLTQDEAALLHQAKDQDLPVCYRFSTRHFPPLTDIRLATPGEVSDAGA
jgi:hypothetical protein